MNGREAQGQSDDARERADLNAPFSSACIKLLSPALGLVNTKKVERVALNWAWELGLRAEEELGELLVRGIKESAEVSTRAFSRTQLASRHSFASSLPTVLATLSYMRERLTGIGSGFTQSPLWTACNDGVLHAIQTRGRSRQPSQFPLHILHGSCCC